MPRVKISGLPCEAAAATLVRDRRFRSGYRLLDYSRANSTGRVELRLPNNKDCLLRIRQWWPFKGDIDTEIPRRKDDLSLALRLEGCTHTRIAQLVPTCGDVSAAGVCECELPLAHKGFHGAYSSNREWTVWP